MKKKAWMETQPIHAFTHFRREYKRSIFNRNLYRTYTSDGVIKLYDCAPLFQGEKGVRHLFGYVEFLVTEGTEETESTVTPLDDEMYITFSTCSYEYENARYVVIGRMVKK